MKVLLNGLSMNEGGGVQVLSNFIYNTLNSDDGIEWYYLLTHRIKNIFERAGVILPRKDRTLLINNRPAKLLTRAKINKLCLEFEKDNCIDIVYSISSPSYLKFKSIEIQRLTNPYVLCPNKYAYGCFDFSERLKRRFKSYLQYRSLKNTSFFVTQTEYAKDKIIKLFKLPSENVEIVPNAISNSFREHDLRNVTKENIVFCLFANYPHKNLFKLPLVASFLKKKTDEDFVFYITIDNEDKSLIEFNKLLKKYEVEKHFVNLGRISQAECVKYYLKSKVTFLPTYLEVFSATLIESMYMKVPVVTTNFDFNKTIAKDAAYYFDAEDWEGASDLICKLLTKKMSQKKVNKVEEIVSKIPFSDENYSSTTSFLKNIYHENLNNNSLLQ